MRVKSVVFMRQDALAILRPSGGKNIAKRAVISESPHAGPEQPGGMCKLGVMPHIGNPWRGKLIHRTIGDSRFLAGLRGRGRPGSRLFKIWPPAPDLRPLPYCHGCIKTKEKS